MMRRLPFLAVLLLLSALLRADFLFWLDSPGGRNNPHDPKNPNFSASSMLPLAPIPTPTATMTPVPGALLVKLYDNAGLAAPGKWVQVNNNSAGAKQSNASGQANFTGVSFPATVHVFPGVSGTVGVISVLGVTGPTLQVWSVGGTGRPGVTLTATMNHSFGTGAGYYLTTFDAQGNETGGQGSGAGGSPAVMTFTGQQQGDTANLMAYNYDSLGNVFQEAAFAPSTPLSGSNTNLSFTLGSSGWSSATLPVTISDPNYGGSYYLRAYAGASVSSYYTLPVMSTYSSPGPAALYGPVLFPSPLSFCSIELSVNDIVPPVSYSRYVRQNSSSIPASLSFTMQPVLQWTRSPTAVDPHVTVLDTDPVKPDIMQVYTSDWYVVSLEPGQGQGIDAQYPSSLPAGVVLTPFAGPGPFYAGAQSWACVSPVAQVVGYGLPYILRGNYVNVQY